VDVHRAPRASGIGWVFPGVPATAQQDAVEFACVPFIESPGGALRPMFEIQAGQQRQYAQLADNHELDATIIQQPHRAYHPAARQGSHRIGTPDAQPAGPVGELDQALAAIADQAGATLHTYPRPGPTARRITLRDERDGRGTRRLDAAVDHDGTLRITGHDQGPDSAIFGVRRSPPTTGSISSPLTGSQPSSRSWAATTVTTCSRSWPPTTSARAGRSATS
jgi:hypothetical protein